MTLKRTFSAFLVLTILLGCKKDEINCEKLITCYLKEECNEEVDPIYDGYSGYDITYYPINGTLIKKDEGAYLDGKKHGYWQYYFQNGVIEREGNYKNGEVHGYWKKRLENGSMVEEGNYTNCKRDGFWKFYSTTVFNQIKYEGSINQDILGGNWKEYDEFSGELLKSTTCGS